MHKYNAHAATDVTGFGILGHAQNLAKNQKQPVSFVIHNLPIIAKMATVAKVMIKSQLLLSFRCFLKLSALLLKPVWTLEIEYLLMPFYCPL